MFIDKLVCKCIVSIYPNLFSVKNLYWPPIDMGLFTIKLINSGSRVLWGRAEWKIDLGLRLRSSGSQGPDSARVGWRFWIWEWCDRLENIQGQAFIQGIEINYLTFRYVLLLLMYFCSLLSHMCCMSLLSEHGLLSRPVFISFLL